MTTPDLDFKNIGRNDLCPCGSNKKFKRCHGQDQSAWQGNAPAKTAGESSEAPASQAPQFDPSKMDLNWLANFSAAIQRLPKGQMNRLQSLMQKAMAGKDVAREMEEFQRTLPLSVQELLKNSPQLEEQMNAAKVDGNSVPAAELTDEQKAKLAEIQKNNQKSGFSGLWNRFRKK